MSNVNVLAIVAVAVVVVVLSTAYYIAFTKQLAALSRAYADASDTQPPPWKIAIEFVRSLVVASVVAGLAEMLGLTDWTDGLKLGFSLWIGFPVVFGLGPSCGRRSL